MTDSKTTLAELKVVIDAFLKEREWHQFHSPKTDCMGIATEAAELMELFLYTQTKEDERKVMFDKREQIEDELADIFSWVLIFAQTQDIDLAAAFEKKLTKNKRKYPVEKCKGLAKKYTEL